jgi:hypothetical protein
MLVTLALLVASGCTGSGDDESDQGTGPSDTDTVALSLDNCPTRSCNGTLGGARYQIRLPASWNGTLLLYSHAYRPADPWPKGVAVSPHAAGTVAPTPVLADRLLELGYALAGSDWSSDGYAPKEGITAGAELYEYFRKNIAPPKRTYVWGESIGANVSEVLAERYDWVSGAAPMCGFLAGANPNFDLWLDLSFAIKVLLDPSVKIGGYTSYADALAAWKKMGAASKAAISGGPKQIARLLLVSALANQIQKSRRADATSNVQSRVQAGIDLINDFLAGGTLARYELEQRVGGQPSTNVETNYAARVSAQERNEINVYSPGSVDKDLAILKKARKIVADPGARSAAGRLDDPSGKLRVPTVTLHTAADSVAVVQNESAFSHRALRTNQRSGDLMQVFTVPPATYGIAPYGVGHCNFTTDEQLGVLTNLDRWVRSGDRPPSLDLQVAMRGPNRVPGTGFDPTYVPGPWPAEREIG